MQEALFRSPCMATRFEVCTVNEAAKELRVSPATIRRLIWSGALKASKIGRSVRIERRTLKNILEKGVSRGA